MSPFLSFVIYAIVFIAVGFLLGMQAGYQIKEKEINERTRKI